MLFQVQVSGEFDGTSGDWRPVFGQVSDQKMAERRAALAIQAGARDLRIEIRTGVSAKFSTLLGYMPVTGVK